MFDPDTISALKWLALTIAAAVVFVLHFVFRVS